MRIVIDIPEEERVKTAYAETYNNYKELVPDPNDPEKLIDNPESIWDFIKERLIETLEEVTSSYELKLEKENLHKNFQRINLKGD